MSPALRFLRDKAIEVSARLVIRSLYATIRCERVGDGPLSDLRVRGQPVVLVCWHEHLLQIVHYHRDEGMVALVSEHSDGEILARILARIGTGTARGSSTRGGMKGLRELVRAGREGHDLALTPDGPRGPRRVFKLGALAAAQMTGFPIVPMATRASAAWRFGSWDRFLLPKPFAKLQLHYGAPHWVPRTAGEEELQRHASILRRKLNELAGEARPFHPVSEKSEGRRENAIPD